MSTYDSKDSGVLSVQLKVQSLCVRLADNVVVSTTGSTATLNVKEPITAVVNAIFIDDSAGTSAPVAAANRVVSGTQVTLTLSAAMTASDSIILNYIVAE